MTSNTINKALVLVVSVLGLCSCSQDRTSRPNEAVHPNLELALSEAPVETQRIEIRGAPQRDLISGITGRYPADSTTFLATVTDISLSRDRVAALDAGQSQVLVFDSSGVLLQAFGSRGVGPGEIAHAQAVGIADDGTVVLAQRTQIVKVFRQIAGQGYQETNSFETPSLPYDVCVLGQEVFLRMSDADSDTMVQVYSLDGHRLRGFGKRYPLGTSLTRSKLSEEGFLNCSARSGLVLVSWTYQPFVSAYGKDGIQQWHSRISEHRIPRITERSRDGRPGLTFQSPEPGDLWPVGLGSVHTGPDGAVAVASYQLIGSDGRVVRVALSLQDGSVVSVDTSSTRHYGSTDDGLLVSGTDMPIPSIHFSRQEQ